MMKRIRSIPAHRCQKGMTLVELLIAFALVGIVTTAITATTSHLFSGSTRTSNHMTAVRQVQSAGYWLNHHTMQARNVVLDEDDSSGFPLTLTWQIDGVATQVIYELQGTDLLRNYNGQQTVVAQFIESIHVEALSRNEHRFTITATVGPGSPYAQSETREYTVKSRPD